MIALLCFAAVAGAALLVLGAARVRSLSLAYMGFFVLCAAQVVAVMTGLGLAGLLSAAPVALCHAGCLLAALLLSRHLPAGLAAVAGAWWAAARRLAVDLRAAPLWLTACLGAVAAAYAVTLVLALAAPPSIQDAMTYYLGRIGFWLQQQSLAFFPTNNLRQTTYPPNASLLYAWTILLSGGDALIQPLQWVAASVSAVGVYSLARQLGAARRARVFCALLWVSAPIVVLESSSVQIDLVATAWVTAACVYAVEYLRRGGALRLALAALASGLAVGAKFTVLVMLPGAALVLAALSLRGLRRGDRRPSFLTAAAAAAVLCLGSFVYLESWRHYGHVDMARREYVDRRIEVLRPLAVNAVRYSYQLFDTSGLPPALRRGAEALKYRAGRLLFGGYAETLLSDEFLMEHYSKFGRIFTPTLTYVQLVHPDRVGMGLLGPLLVVLLPVALAKRRRRVDRGLVLALGLLFASFCVALCVVAGYHYFHCRYNATTFALLAPLASMLYAESGRRRAVAAALAALAVLQCWTALLLNENRPFLGARPWWSYDRIALATINHPENDGILRALAERVPATATLGIATAQSGWVYPFFAPGLTRRVLHVAVDDRLEEAAALRRRGIEFLYVHRKRSEILAFASRQPWLHLVWRDDLGTLFALRNAAANG